MGNKVAAYWEVRFYRREGYSVLSKSRTVDLGRAAFWATVDQRHADMLESDIVQLSHGSRIILTARVLDRRQSEIQLVRVVEVDG